MDEKENETLLEPEKPDETLSEPEKQDKAPEEKSAYKKPDSLYAKNDPDLAVTYEPPKEGPATIKCPNCGEEMPSTIDTCVNCGHYLKTGKRAYKPMSEDKIKKIRWTIGIICIVAFILFWVFFRK